MINNIFGTDGIRAYVGSEPLTAQSLHKLGKAIAQWALNKYQKDPVILLGHDTRISCDFVKNSLKSGLLLYPVTILDSGVLTSPAISQLIKNNSFFDCGIIISASHNPYQDNGIKIIDRKSGKLSSNDEEVISTLFSAPPHVMDYTNLGKDLPYIKAADIYTQTLLSYFKTDAFKDLTIVLDCAYGAAYEIAPLIFKKLGAHVITLHDVPNGYNINFNSGTLHPERLQKTVVEYKADIGFAFDGDADRVLVVNHKGELKDGDDILVYLLNHPLYQNISTIVGTVMSNQGLASHLEKQNITLVRQNVGDKYIASFLATNNLILGGEPSGHIILRDYLHTGDGIFVALRILETLLHSANYDIITFTKFPQVLFNVPINQKKDLSMSPFKDLIESDQRQLRNGRLLVRYSGTELLLRIMIEDSDYDHAYLIGKHLATKLSNALLE